MITNLINSGYKFKRILLRNNDSGIVDVTVESPIGTTCHGEGVNLECAVVNALARINVETERYLRSTESELDSLKYQLKETIKFYDALRVEHQDLTTKYLEAQKELTSVGSAHNELKIHHQELLNDLSASGLKIAELETNLKTAYDEILRWVAANTAIGLELSQTREAKNLSTGDTLITMLNMALGDQPGVYSNGSFEVAQESPINTLLIDAEDNPCIVKAISPEGSNVLAAIDMEDNWSTIRAIRNGKKTVRLVYDEMAWTGDVAEMTESVGTGNMTLTITKPV